jgi:hypothetical protein
MGFTMFSPSYSLECPKSGHPAAAQNLDLVVVLASHFCGDTGSPIEALPVVLTRARLQAASPDEFRPYLMIASNLLILGGCQLLPQHNLQSKTWLLENRGCQRYSRVHRRRRDNHTMFTNKTVFILGSGASWHYNYPTGETLVTNVKTRAQTIRDYFNDILNNTSLTAITTRPNYIKRHSPDLLPTGTTGMKEEWANALRECDDLIDRLTSVDPLVIDYFLGQNKHLRDIGRFVIAYILLECEAAFRKAGANITNRRNATPKEADNWYRFLIHKLVTGCHDGEALLDNNVTFITFNYDVSLEFYLFNGLSKLAQFATGDILTRFFSENRFLHIYGKIREDSFADPPALSFHFFDHTRAQPTGADEWIAAKGLFDAAYDASKTIRTIAPYEKVIDPDPIVEAAKAAISEASCVYILGYGFDPFNSQLLELDKSLDLEKTKKAVMFTNFQNRNVINKNASRIFFGCRDRILSNMPDVVGQETKGYLCERSTRNVYDALADDFDSPEEHLQATSRIW